MPIEIPMPRLSDTMQQGTIVKWNVKEGQRVKSGDVLADIETDKATMELQSFDDGVVARLGVSEGQTVPVGTVIVVLAGAGEDAAAIRAGATPAVAKATDSAGEQAAGGPAIPATATVLAEPPAAAERAFVSPLARKIAQESGVDLRRVEGTGPGGRITRKDVEAAAGPGGTGLQTGDRAGGGGTGLQTGAPVHAPGLTAARIAPTPDAMIPPPGVLLAPRTVALSNKRRVIAARLIESTTTIPHYQVSVDVDMDALSALREQLNAQLAHQGVRLSVNDFLVRACALGMHSHPYVNSRWVEPGGGGGGGGEPAIRILADVNIGVAIALPEEKGGGLVVATIRNADGIGLRKIAAQTRELGEKARTRGLSPQEMSDATFTISNLGMFGVSHFTAIINPPNAAILAVGAATPRAVVREGRVVPGLVMTMTMSSDHRIVDGAMAAAYLNSVKNMLEKPATLLV